MAGEYTPGSLLAALKQAASDTASDTAVKSALFAKTPTIPPRTNDIIATAKTKKTSVKDPPAKKRNKKRTSETVEDSYEQAKASHKNARTTNSESFKQNPQSVSTAKGFREETESGLMDKPRKRKPTEANESDVENRKLKPRGRDGALTVKTDASKPAKDKQRTRVSRDRRELTEEQREALRRDRDARTVYVGNLPVSTGKKFLRKHFADCGTVEFVRFRSLVPSDPSKPKHAAISSKAKHKEMDSICAYLVFSDVKGAAAAVKRNGTEHYGHTLRIDLASRAGKHDNRRSVFVGNLPFDVKEEPLRQHFADCGLIENVRVIRDNRTGAGKGFGYILFQEGYSVQFALKMDGSSFSGRALRVQSCSGKQRQKQRRADTTSTHGKQQQKEKKPPPLLKKIHKPSNVSKGVLDGMRAQKLKQAKHRMKKRVLQRKQRRTPTALPVSAEKSQTGGGGEGNQN